MDEQEEGGWPLGLQPLNNRRGLIVTRNNIADLNNNNNNGSLSFNTLLSATSPPISSTDSSSDLDTQSTGSFFHDNSITLGSLIGISNILELSRRSSRVGTITQPKKSTNKLRNSNYKSKTCWFLSICSRLSTDAVTINNNNSPSSLGHFLEAERRAANTYRSRNPTSVTYGLDDFSHLSDPNSLFVGGNIAPPPDNHESTLWLDANATDGAPLLLSCLCGKINLV